MLKVKNYKKNVDLISRNNSHDKGITLVALVITIIVMLILVGVSVNEAFNKGIFETAKDAAKQTEIESDRETLLSAVVTSLARKNGNTASYIEDNLPNGWEVTGADGGPYKAKSPNGNIFVVEKDGTIRLDGEAAPTPPEEDAPITPPEDDPITPPKTFPGGWTETTKPEGWSNSNNRWKE